MGVPALDSVCLLALATLSIAAQRLFCSIVSCLLALGTWITSNLGGFILGLMLCLIGSSMAFGWLPEQEPRRRWLRRSRSSSSPAS